MQKRLSLPGWMDFAGYNAGKFMEMILIGIDATTRRKKLFRWYCRR